MLNIATHIASAPTPAEPLYHYCIVRADLPLGVQLAQTVHAAGESSPGDLPSDTRAVMLHVAGAEELLALEAKLRAAGVTFTSIREPDMPWDGQIMAIGLKPCIRTKALRKLMSGLPLAGVKP